MGCCWRGLGLPTVEGITAIVDQEVTLWSPSEEDHSAEAGVGEVSGDTTASATRKGLLEFLESAAEVKDLAARGVEEIAVGAGCYGDDIRAAGEDIVEGAGVDIEGVESVGACDVEQIAGGEKVELAS